MVNETELIRSIIAGADRYEELVNRYHVGLIIHCEHLVGDRDDAEDIAQEAFVKAYLRLKDFDYNKSHFSTWLYKIATNLAIDYLRARKHIVDVHNLESAADSEIPLDITEEEKQEVRTVVSKLMPPEYRQVIEAYYWQGKSYQQIADDHQVALNTIRTWIRRAKLQLREDLS